MASYQPPNNQNGSIFNPSDWIEPNAGSIDTAYLNEHYCQFPVAQGNMSFAGISNTGTTTIGQNLVMEGIYNTNYLEFPDGTKQYTAVAGSDILNTDNSWVGVNNFFPNTQTYGSTLNEGLTFTNNQYINGSGDTDIIAYIPNSTTGLCIFALNTNSATFATPQIQLLPDGTASNFQASGVNGIVSIIANNTGGKIKLQSDAGVQLVHNASLTFSTFGNLTGSSTGISSSVNLTAPSLTTQLITQTADNTNISITGSGLNSSIILNSTAGVSLKTNPIISFDSYGTLTASSSGLTSNMNLIAPNINTPSITQTADNTNISITGSGLNSSIILNSTAGVSLKTNPTISFDSYGTLTASSSGLTSSVSLLVPTQPTYNNGTTYGNSSATQAFVKSAINSISAGGDVYLGANNNFTGTNTFSGFCGGTSTPVYPQPNSNQFATIQYVNSLNTVIGSLPIAFKISEGEPYYITSTFLPIFTISNTIAQFNFISPIVRPNNGVYTSDAYKVGFNIQPPYKSSPPYTFTSTAIGQTTGIVYPLTITSISNSTNFTNVFMTAPQVLTSENWYITLNGYFTVI